MSNTLSPREKIEREIMGCLFFQPDLIPQVQAEWFDDLRITELFNLLKAMHATGEIIHYGTLWHKKPTDETLSLVGDFRDLCDTPEVFPQLKKEWLNMVQTQRATQVFQEIEGSRGTPGFSLNQAIKKLQNAVKLDEEQVRHSYTPSQIASAMIDRVETRFNLNGKLSGLATGFKDFDRFTDGLQPGENSILAARPSVGKTALAVNLVNKICIEDKIPTLFLSLEMTTAALSQRLLACNQHLDMRTLRTGQLTEMDFERVTKFNRVIKDSPLFIEEHLGSLTASGASALIRHYAKKYGVKFVVVDYLQNKWLVLWVECREQLQVLKVQLMHSSKTLLVVLA